MFAIWSPLFDGKGLDSEFVTDANGLELITRSVYVKDSAPVSSSFYPVTTTISASDKETRVAMTIRNDRPQAGSVHYDGTIKLLIDRRVTTIDEGGIPEKMRLDFKDNLRLNFRLEFQSYEEAWTQVSKA